MMTSRGGANRCDDVLNPPCRFLAASVLGGIGEIFPCVFWNDSSTLYDPGAGAS